MNEKVIEPEPVKPEKPTRSRLTVEELEALGIRMQPPSGKGFILPIGKRPPE